MDKDSCIILEPVNRPQIDKAIKEGIKIFIGGNCSTTLSLLDLAAVIKADLVEWMSIMTYQSASGGGAEEVREFITQSCYISSNLKYEDLAHQAPILQLVKRVGELISSSELPTEALGAPLMGSFIPWIDSDLGDGNSREEWKAR
ncbi:Asd/ArgC dimerization domain-containing protein [Aeromonas jandaei]|jgi:aspartate-semialdehyde dehydrogenase|uniref:Asd/ArgC dimerization domain-containing protein n=1 Tax=Aeromonas jandaei TaxID=650 RepID=UPI00214B4919